MPYAIVLYLDPQKAKPIRRVIHELAQKSIAPYMQEHAMRPHITLAIYEGLNCQTCESKISGLAGRIRGFDLNFSFLGIFHSENPVVFIGPTTSRELLEIHSQLYEVLKADANHPWELYEPGQWVPHCSLAVEFPIIKLQEAVQTCLKLTLPLSIPVASLGVVQFEPLQALYNYEIGKTESTD
ncbi:MAG: 2'-5' RNA ligase family protein [Anaerolineaceae bacterium]